MVSEAILGFCVPMSEGFAHTIEDPAFNLDWHAGSAEWFIADARHHGTPQRGARGLGLEILVCAALP